MVDPAVLPLVRVAPASAPMELPLPTLGAGPLNVPLEPLDPVVTGTVQLARANLPQSSNYSPAHPFQLNQNTDEYNFSYNQGFLPLETHGYHLQQQPA